MPWPCTPTARPNGRRAAPHRTRRPAWAAARPTIDRLPGGTSPPGISCENRHRAALRSFKVCPLRARLLNNEVCMSNIVVVALYKFVTLEDFQSLREPLLDTMNQHGVRGTLLLALEVINGTVAGTREGTSALLEWLRRDPR